VKGNWVRLLLLFAGAALLVALLRQVGWSAVVESLSRVGWPVFLGLLVLAVLGQFAFAEGWRETFEPRPEGAARMRLWTAYIAGDAANTLGGGVAGEPLRVFLVAKEHGAASAFVSVNVRKHAELAAQCAYLVPSLAVSLTRFSLPAPAVWAAAVSAAGMVGLLAFMTWAFRKGSYAPILRILSRIRPLAARLARFEHRAAAVDGRIREFETAHPGRVAASAGWALAGWLSGLVETWILLRLLVPGAGFAAALAVESLSMVANSVLLFVPGRVGSAEGVRVGVFVLLGLPAPAGVAYALVRRARELVWLVAGLLVLARRHLSPFRAPTPAGPESVSSGRHELS
jgi:uncharacterized membrane protein YbhN (UPF0104 family)